MSNKVSRILILGNGPSLKKEYFEMFRNVPCLGMNAAYRFWQRIDWYPAIYCCLDDQLILTHADPISEIWSKRLCNTFFLHENILQRHPDMANAENVYFLPQLCPGHKNQEKCLRLGLHHNPSDFFLSGQPAKLTTGSYSVRFAAFLGFREIGLIGTDCRYVEMVEGAAGVGGNVLEIKQTPAQNPNYFFNDYQVKGDRYNIPNPATHQGNLHLQAFEALRDDISQYSFELDLNICTTESELFDRNVFPYRDLGRFLQPNRLSAVFIPFTPHDLDRLLDNLGNWGLPEFAPCIPGWAAPEVELHFAMNSNRDTAAEQAILTVFREQRLDRYFAGPHFHYSNLSGLDDQYTRSLNGECGPEGYMAGPNNQFFDIILHFSRGMSHILLIEPDAVPLRAGWLQAAAEIVGHSGRFWICGSHYRGRASIRTFTHINGNAFYNVGDREFQQFLTDTFLPYFYQRMRTMPSLCYDVMLHDYFRVLHSEEAPAERVAVWKNTAHRFLYCEFIADVSAEADRAPEKLLSLDAARREFPGCYVLHGAVDAVLRDISQRGCVKRKPAAPDKFQSPVLILDPDASSVRGHFMAYNTRLQRALERLGVEAQVLCNREIPQEIAQSNPHYRPCLSVPSWELKEWRRGRQREVTTEQELQHYLLEFGKGENPPTTLYAYCGSFALTRVFRKVIEKGLDIYPHVNLFWTALADIGATEFRDEWAEHVRWLASHRRRMRVTAPTPHIQRDLLRYFGAFFPVARHPSPAFGDREFHLLRKFRCHPEPPPLRILFPAAPRSEKGRELVPGILERVALNQSAMPWKCVLRNPGTGAYDSEIMGRITANHPDLVEEWPAELPEDMFRDMLVRAHVAVLPYQPSMFAKRTSGLLIDVIYCGLPPVVTPGTWLADMVREYRCGVVADSSKPDAVMEAIQKVAGNYQAFHQRTVVAAKRHQEHNSWDQLARSIVVANAQPSTRAIELSDPLDTESDVDETQLPSDSISRTLHMLEEKGCQSLALYGAGEHTRRLLDNGRVPRQMRVVCVFDDSASSDNLQGIPVLNPASRHSSIPQFDAVLISSDTIEPKLWRQAIRHGMHPVYTIYSWTRVKHREKETAACLFNYMRTSGIERVALYGAGLFTHNRLQAGAFPDRPAITCILDDAITGTMLDVPVIQTDRAAQAPQFDAVVICSDTVTGQLQQKAFARGWRNVFPLLPPPNEDSAAHDLLSSGPARTRVHIGTASPAAVHRAIRAGWAVHVFESRPGQADDIFEQFGSNHNMVCIHRVESPGPVTNAGSDVFSRLAEHQVSHVDYLEINGDNDSRSAPSVFPWELLRPDVVIYDFNSSGEPLVLDRFREALRILEAQHYSILLSEWYSSASTEKAQAWCRLARYPCELRHQDNAGKLIAFATPELRDRYAELMHRAGYDIDASAKEQ